MRDLFDRFGLGDLPQNEKRKRLAVVVLGVGAAGPARLLISPRRGQLATVIVVQAPTRMRSPSASGTSVCGAIGDGSSPITVPFVEPRSRTTQGAVGAALEHRVQA